MKSARFGVIGVGGWGGRHVQAYRQHPHARLAGICDLRQEALDSVGERFGVEARFTDYRELLAMDGLDAVSIVTPDFAHLEPALEAIARGKHVLIEKPLATSMEDCDCIGQALRERPVKFMVDFHNRWSPGVAQMKQRIDAGEIGRPLMASYRLNDNISVPTRMLPWAGRSNVNWFVGSHCLDTLRWLLGDEVAKVYTASRSVVLKGMGIDTPDFYQSLIEFAGGATALLETCWIVSERTPRIFDMKVEIVGEAGTLFFSGSPDALEVFTSRGAENPDTFVCPEVHGRGVGFGLESIYHFADCVAGDREPMAGFEDGCEVTRVILAMEESARTGRAVVLR